jgi:O-succinylbenzoic acid--CoA ligase
MGLVSSLRPVSGTADEVLTLLRAWEAAAHAEPLVIATSGSTGRAKRVVLSREAMRASADATHARLGGPGTWELDLPPTYVAGLQVLWRQVRGGGGPRRYTSVVPTQLVRALRGDPADGVVRELATFDAVLVGGGPLAPEARAEAEAAGVPVVQTYGMSETCGGCVYDGHPLDGVELRLREGEVQLRGPVLFDGYDGEPERTARVMDDGWFRTDDLGELDADGRLRVTGRRDDVILSGGVNVPAVAVAAAVRTHEDVLDAVVVGAPDVEWGQRVVAVVEASRPVSLAALRDLVEPRTWAPRRLLVLDELPRLANGKPDRVAIQELADRD